MDVVKVGLASATLNQLLAELAHRTVGYVIAYEIEDKDETFSFHVNWVGTKSHVLGLLTRAKRKLRVDIDRCDYEYGEPDDSEESRGA